MKFSFLLSLFLLLSISACTFPEPAQPVENPPEEDEKIVQQELLSLMELMEFVRENYVDADKVKYETLFQGAMKGMLENLDPYSSYDTPQEFKLMMESSSGSFAGIGATVQKDEDGRTKIVKVLPGKPADKAGLKAEDIILSADGFPFFEKPLDECVSKLRGDDGTILILQIERKDSPVKNYEVKREIIRTPSITNKGVIRDKTGYFRVNQFTATTAEEMDDYLKEYSKKIDRLIIDLRFNPGGQLDVTVEMLSRFLEKGLLIVSVEGRTEKPVRHESVSCRKYTKLPIVVLINEYSASASEIFSGCMKDYKRAVIVGKKSFGKGSVQRVFPMPDGGGVRVTIAKYYTPSRTVIHGHGIEPDETVKITAKEKQQISEYFMNHETAPPVIGKDGYKDSQLEKALDIVKGMKEFQITEQQIDSIVKRKENK